MLGKSRCDSQNLSIFFNFTIHVTVHIIVYSNPNLDFHLCFHCQTLLILVMLRKSRCDSQNLSIFLNFTIYVTIHVTVHSNPNLNFHLCFHCQTLLILVPFGNPKIPIIFQPISHQNLTLNPQNRGYTRFIPTVLNQILFIPPCHVSVWYQN